MIKIHAPTIPPITKPPYLYSQPKNTWPKPESNKSDTVQKFNLSHHTRTSSGRKSLSQPFPKNSGRSIERRNEQRHVTTLPPPFKTNV